MRRGLQRLRSSSGTQIDYPLRIATDWREVVVAVEDGDEEEMGEFFPILLLVVVR